MTYRQYVIYATVEFNTRLLRCFTWYTDGPKNVVDTGQSDEVRSDVNHEVREELVLIIWPGVSVRAIGQRCTNDHVWTTALDARRHSSQTADDRTSWGGSRDAQVVSSGSPLTVNPRRHKY